MKIHQGDGSLNSLTVRFVIVIFLFIAVGCNAESHSLVEAQKCVENTLGYRVVRIDERNHRFFLSGSAAKAKSIELKIDQLRQCFSSSDWSGVWSLSVFSDEKYAGYKDEKDIVHYHADNSWANAYIAEYSEDTHELVSYPAIDPKVIKLGD
jgi:hypothetical protein